MYRTDFCTLWEKARVGCFERTACILSVVKQITSPGGMHETSARAWCTGKTQRNQVEREVGGGIGMGNTCNSMADSCQGMTNPLPKKEEGLKTSPIYFKAIKGPHPGKTLEIQFCANIPDSPLL